MRRVAVFASGAGSNFQAIVDAVRTGTLEADICLLVCDQPGAPVIDRARRAGIPTFVRAPKSFSEKAAYERAVLDALKVHDISFIVLAGYMRLVGPTLLSAFPNRIVNLHPSLLPAFPGLHAIEQAARAGVKVTGVTIHYVDAGMDTGPIIAQRAIEIKDGETLDQLTERIHDIEHKLYPETLAKLFSSDIPQRSGF
ncbi:phosphoribosylglycinamide formyltransferase [Camelliibacillus cellulosilyticus]|uniref:Phosphoribosylglycinamide formyltransferase n=1 Tax=Camelliibacillus cellulosilyticus TaxID=2174486 RepID=A0ABV9GLG2_9BACL